MCKCVPIATREFKSVERHTNESSLITKSDAMKQKGIFVRNIIV